MKPADVIIIGGGLAGLMAAAVAANRGQKATLLTYGSDSLPRAIYELSMNVTGGEPK